MRPTSPASRNRRSGFLLAEVLVAFAILALVAAIVFPRLANVTGPALLKASAFDVAGILRADRTIAIRSGKPVVTGIDTRGRQVRAGGTVNAVTLPDDVRVTVAYAANEPAPGVRFFPNGSASGAKVTLRSRSGSYNVNVDWFTGAIIVEGPYAP